MAKLFISYRRDDAEEAAGRLSDYLVSRFGRANIFMDVDAIDPGRDFRKVIDEILAECDVLLGVMGRSWLECKDEAGNRRLDDPRDYVRLELATALRRDIPVIPVRVQGASLPKIDQLPDDLKEFAYRNAFELTHERWNSDVQLLTDKLRRYMTDTGMQSGSDAAAQGAAPPTTPATPPPVNQQWAVAPPAQAAALEASPPVATATKPVKKIARWCLVGLFLFSLLVSMGNGEGGTAFFSLVAVGVLAWDPFKWFRDKS